jgi:hypothetical protein
VEELRKQSKRTEGNLKQQITRQHSKLEAKLQQKLGKDEMEAVVASAQQQLQAAREQQLSQGKPAAGSATAEGAVKAEAALRTPPRKQDFAPAASAFGTQVK